MGSGDIFKSSKEIALNSGMDDYITKPIDFDNLFLTIFNLLAKDASRKIISGEKLKVDADLKKKIIKKIKELKQFDIYETEKLMDNILNIESILLNNSGNSILNNQILDLKGAILDGDEAKMIMISDQITISIK